MLPLLVCAALFASATTAYSIPDPEFQVLKPRGLKVSIPYEDGIEAFSFHGNINRDIKGLEPGQITQDASVIENGKFTIYDENVNLQNGDVINYWLYAVHRGLDYHLENGKFVYQLQESNKKDRECPPGYKKKALVAPQTDEVTAWSSSGYDETTGSDGLYNYHGNYQHGFRPNFYYGRPWYGFNPRGHWHHFHGPRFDYGRGRGHNRWARQNDHFHYNPLHLSDAATGQGDIGIPAEQQYGPVKVKRNTDFDDDKSEEDDVQLESRFGGFSRGFGGANFIRTPRPPHKPYVSRGYGYHGHGHGYDGRNFEHGYGFYPGHRHGPRRHPHPGGPYHNKFGDDYDCEEDDSNESGPEPMNLDTTSSSTSTTTTPTTTTPTTTTTTTTTTQPTSSVPQIDIRFGES